MVYVVFFLLTAVVAFLIYTYRLFKSDDSMTYEQRVAEMDAQHRIVMKRKRAEEAKQ
jgi:hypothetical protein